MKRGSLPSCLFLLLAFAGFGVRAQDPDFYTKLYNQIFHGLAQTNPPAALALISDYISLHPRNPRYYYYRGGIYHMMDEPFKAIDDFTRSIQVFDEEKQSPEDSVFTRRAEEWLRLGYLEKSLADLDSIELRWPKRAFELVERGMVLYELGEYERAAKQFVNYGYAHGDDVELAVWKLLCQAKIEGLQRARPMVPVKGDVRVPMPEIYALFQGTGSPEQVLQAARAAGPRANPGDLPPAFYANYYLGLYFDLMGDADGAVASLQAALDLPMPGNAKRDFARVHRDQLLRGWQNQFRAVPARLVQPRRGLGHFFAKLKAGGEARVAFFGGSITAAQGWRGETMDWLRQTYTNTSFSEINAAIGGTGSDLGAFRFERDVLSQKPDLVFVEFSVNDGGAEPAAIWRALEGVLRQAWRTNESVDFCFVYTFAKGLEKDLQAGLCPRAAGADEVLARYYDLPSINVALLVAEKAGRKTLEIQPAAGETNPPPGVMLFSKDGVHPLREAHHLYFETIRDGLAAMASSQAAPHWLKSPFLPDNWENARLAPVTTNMTAGEWQIADDPSARRFKNRLPVIWTTSQPGAALSFKFRGTAFGFYDVIGPDSGKVWWLIDGKAGAPVSRFDSFCSYYRLSSFFPSTRLPDGPHEVRLFLDAAPPDKHTVLDQEKGKPGFDPGPYERNVLRVGAILIVGDLIP